MNKRLNNVSLLRFVSFTIIVIYHCLLVLSEGQGKKLFPGYFAVQIFIFLTAYLYSKKKIVNVKEFYIKNVVKLIVPTVLLLILEFVLCLIINPSVANPAEWGEIYNKKIFALGHLWFMWFILICYILIPFLQLAFDKNHKYNKLGKIIIAFMVILELCYFGFFDAQVGFIALFAGYYFGKKQDDIKQKGGLVVLFSTLFVLFAGSYLLLKNCVSSTSSLINGFVSGGLNYLSALLGISTAIIFLISFEFLNKYDSIKLFKITDKYSFQIYLYHYIFIVGTLSMLSLTPYVSVNIILMLLATLVCAVVMEFVSGKLIKFINKLIFKKKKQIS